MTKQWLKNKKVCLKVNEVPICQKILTRSSSMHHWPKRHISYIILGIAQVSWVPTLFWAPEANTLIYPHSSSAPAHMRHDEE